MKPEDDFQFGRVAFFGRGIEEYALMFNLDIADLKARNEGHSLKILDCPAGPAAFARQANAEGLSVTACDPLYCYYDINLLREMVEMDAHAVGLKQANSPELFHPELTPAAVRREAMELFLEDYVEGRIAGRYVYATLPELPFNDATFDIVLSANLLFLYSDIASGGMMASSMFDYEFHRRAILELLRVSSHEVRIYPLRGPGKKEHAYLRPLIGDLQALGLNVEIQPVRQRDIIGAEEMLLITKTKN